MGQGCLGDPRESIKLVKRLGAGQFEVWMGEYVALEPESLLEEVRAPADFYQFSQNHWYFHFPLSTGCQEQAHTVLMIRLFIFSGDLGFLLLDECLQGRGSGRLSWLICLLFLTLSSADSLDIRLSAGIRGKGTVGRLCSVTQSRLTLCDPMDREATRLLCP